MAFPCYGGKESIDEGTELDRAVAQAIGLVWDTRRHPDATDADYEVLGWQKEGWWDGDRFVGSLPKYSTDLNAAFEAAEKVAQNQFGDWELSTYVGHDKDKGWTCQIGDSTERAFSSTPALAICAAILKLKEQAA